MLVMMKMIVSTIKIKIKQCSMLAENQHEERIMFSSKLEGPVMFCISSLVTSNGQPSSLKSDINILLYSKSKLR